MTYASDLGLKVGSKIKYTGNEEMYQHNYFEIGEILTLEQDDGTHMPYFEGQMGGYRFSLLKRGWVKYEEEKAMIERNKEYDIKLTGEQLAFILYLTGETNGGWSSKDELYGLVDRMFLANDRDMIYSSGTWIRNMCKHEDELNQWLDALFKTPETEDERNLRELKEKYLELGETIKATEKK